MGVFLYIIKMQIIQKTDITLLCQTLFDLIVLHMLSHLYLRKNILKKMLTIILNSGKGDVVLSM